MRRNFSLVICTLICIAVVAVNLGGMESGAEDVLKILFNFFMFVIPLAAAALMLLFALVLLLARIFKFSARKPLRLVCTAFPLPVGIACVLLMMWGMITKELAIGCVFLSIPPMMFAWMYR